MAKLLGIAVSIIGKQLRINGVFLVLWICSLYGVIMSIWWSWLYDYFQTRGEALPGNNRVAAASLIEHLADVKMGILLPVSRHSALASFLILSLA